MVIVDMHNFFLLMKCLVDLQRKKILFSDNMQKITMWGKGVIMMLLLTLLTYYIAPIFAPKLLSNLVSRESCDTIWHGNCTRRCWRQMQIGFK